MALLKVPNHNFITMPVEKKERFVYTILLLKKIWERKKKYTMTEMRKKGISSSTLKLWAMIFMIIDHGAAVLLEGATGNGYIAYRVIRQGIGRLAFPIFCFFLVEGFQKTGNRQKYMGRLLLFTLLSEIPYDLAFYGSLFYPKDQNVFFTLLLGFCLLTGLEAAEKTIERIGLRILTYGVITLAVCLLAVGLRCDYDFKGILAIALLYLFRFNKTEQMLAGCAAFSWEITAPLAFIPLAFYNGKRGRERKYFFYIMYPLHLLLLYLIRLVIHFFS